ncbi:MAG: hypothetical protein HRT61_17975 [Ekhidna sp.]|nr:hypothetical protein [Ekhidna sp.]
MNRKKIMFMLLAFAFLGSCSGDDSTPAAGIIGAWELSEIIFESESSSASMSSSRLGKFSLEFGSDSTISAVGLGEQNVFAWSYNATSESFTVSFEGQDQTFRISEDQENLKYQAYAVANMSGASLEERAIVELAASTFIQRQISYNPQASLVVHLKFKRL